MYIVENLTQTFSSNTGIVLVTSTVFEHSKIEYEDCTLAHFVFKIFHSISIAFAGDARSSFDQNAGVDCCFGRQRSAES